MSMCAPKETVDRIKEVLRVIGLAAPLLGLAEVMVLLTLLEAVIQIIPVEALVTEAQLRGGEEHVPGGPIPEEEL
jgi:hypothetical protein